MTLSQWPKRMGLLRAIIVFIVLPLTLAVGATGWVALSWLEREAEARMREDIELIARALQQPLNQAIRTGEPVLLEQSLRSAFSFGRVYGAHIYGQNGRLLAGAGVGVRRFRDERAEAFATLDGQSEGYAALGEQPSHVYFLPLTTQGGRIAAILQITRHPDELPETLAQIRIAGSAGLAGLTLLLSLIVLGGHRRAIGLSLADLREGMTRIANGELNHRIHPDGPHEMRELGEGFNNMLDRIERGTEEIAKRRSAQANLQAELQASRKLAAIGELSAGIAHNLGTPLSVLDGRAQSLLRRKDLDEDTRTSLHTMRSEVSRITQTVRQLMDFARSRPLQRRTTKLSQLARSAVERTRDDPDANNTQIALKTSGDDLSLTIDGPRIEEALCNVLRNVVQAAPEGLVQVNVWSDLQYGYVSIEDSGLGIPESEKPRLFEPFHTTKPVGSGTGLGLAVAHGIARAHGGLLELREGNLSGACFYLTLPRQEAENPQ
jgi:signal transduction histidine kinase